MDHQTEDSRQEEAVQSETYKKRTGTSGIQGKLYETKLISLIYFRMIHDDSIDQFTLATNRDDIGAFDDICFKAKLKGFEKPISVFIQAKHRQNDKRLTFTSETDLAKYFHSYSEIRRTFQPSSNDRIFGGKFDETESFFVMYTTAKDDGNNKIYKSCFADYLNKLLGTGEHDFCTQPSYTDGDLDFLCKIVMKEQITTLAELLAKLICDKSDSVMWMNHDLMFRYHVILARNVLDVSEIKPEGHRIASFRQDFFTNNEEFLVLFKNILWLKVAQSLLLKFLSEPSEVTTLSKLIGSLLTKKNNKLEFVNKSTSDDLKHQLDKANVSQSTVYEAADVAAKEYLLSVKLKVPAFFGNKDLTIRGKPEKVEKSLNYATSKIKELLEKSNPNNIVAIDESLGDRFLKLNGGLASAVGNVLVFDESSKLLKFTDNCESLGSLARRWYESLKSKIENLHEYKLDVKVKNFPKLSFERGEYDVSLVRDFYDKLLFYTNQADQNGVEEILRGEIEDHPCSDVTNFRVRSDVIFLKYHDEIQKLWMTPKVGSYLTNESKIYENAVSNAMSESLMSVLNIMHKIKYKDYTFNENAIKPFNLLGQNKRTVIATESCELTVAKLEQYLGNKDRLVLDLEHIFKLPLENQSTLCTELTGTTKENIEEILIIVCNTFDYSRNSWKRLENIAKAVDGKQIIIVTNETTVGIMTKHFSIVSNVLYGERTVFTDLSVESQKKFLATSKIKVQGEDVILAEIMEEDRAVDLIDEYVFNKLINNETIKLGDTAFYDNYGKMLYTYRRVSRPKDPYEPEHYDVENKVLQTFYDVPLDYVLITGELGMGKSTLLNYLSLKTKVFNPRVWIVRINLSEHEVIEKLLNKKLCDKHKFPDFFEFLCQVALGKEYDKRQKEEWIKEDESIIEVDVNIQETTPFTMKCLGGDQFQLRMFLHYFDTGNLIFLFDGLDEMKISSKWQFETAVLSLHTLIDKLYPLNKVWTTSRSLNIIEQELGPSFKLENFYSLEQDRHLCSFWKINFKLKNSYFKAILKNELFVNAMHMLLHRNHRKPEYLRGYALFLVFLKIHSTSACIDFPYKKFYYKFKINFGLSLPIPYFPDDMMPWDLSRYDAIVHESSHIKFKNSQVSLCVICKKYLIGGRNDLKHHYLMFHKGDIEKKQQKETEFINKLLFEENIEERKTFDSKILCLCDLCFSFCRNKSSMNYECIKTVCEIGKRYECEKCGQLFFEINLVKRSLQRRALYGSQTQKKRKKTNQDRLKTIANRFKMMKQ